MFFILPLLFLFFCCVLMRRYCDHWRPALLLAAVIAASVLTLITECLSLVQQFSFYPLMIAWSLLALFAGLMAFNAGGKAPVWPSAGLKNWALSEKISLGIIVFICGVTAITAAVGAPNTWDSMTYHLSRVEHWIQDRTVAFYPTNIIRQLYITPWVEFAIAHLRILGCGDAAANFVQWAAMAGSLTGVSLIAGQLGAGRTGQLMAAAVAATLPMGILQAVSTQTDYVCSFWLVVFVFFIIEARRTFALVNIIAAGLSLGLAFLTKGNSYIFAVPFLVWYLGAGLRQHFPKCLLGSLLMISLALAINGGQYIRNAQTFGSPTWTSVPLTNGAFDLKILWVNVLKNTSIHLATPLMDVNANMQQAMTKAARSFGADINDPRSTFDQDFSITSTSFDEDYAGNFLHAIAFAVIFVLLWFYRGPEGKIRPYALSVLSCFLLFCLIVRYQPWHSRFHLPLFILFCPVAGAVLERTLKQKSIILGLLFLLGAMPWLLVNHQHPWFGHRSIWNVPRPAQYFYKHADMAIPVVGITNDLKSMHCKQVGLLLGEDTWEYPWWVFMSGKGVRIEHVSVNNPSSSLKYPLGDFQACAVIVSGVEVPPFIMVGSSILGPVGSMLTGDEKITVFLKEV